MKIEIRIKVPIVKEESIRVDRVWDADKIAYGVIRSGEVVMEMRHDPGIPVTLVLEEAE